MAGLTFKERMKRKRAAMSPAQRQQRDAEDRYTTEANTALRKGKRALQGMNPGTNKTLRGTTVGGKAVEVHKSANGMDVIGTIFRQHNRAILITRTLQILITINFHICCLFNRLSDQLSLCCNHAHPS